MPPPTWRRIGLPIPDFHCDLSNWLNQCQRFQSCHYPAICQIGANDADGLNDAVARALATPFTVYDQSDEAVAEGVVGGDPIELEQGNYRIIVSSAPQKSFDEIEIVGGSDIEISL